MNKYTAKEIVGNGILIDSWPCDVGLDGSMQSNGSQEFLYEYNGNNYCVWMDWEDQPVNPDELHWPIVDDIID